MRIVTGEEMREFDRMTIKELGIPGVVLMEHAGLRSALEIAELVKSPGRMLIIAGKGNNGGDGFVIHRWLERWGYDCTTLLLASRNEIQGDAKVNLDILYNLDAEVVEVHTEGELREFWNGIGQYSWIIDGILGTGIKGEVRGLSYVAIELVNQSSQRVAAIDLPSGLDVLKGKPLGAAVRADLTITFGLPKVGLLLYPGRSYVGDLKVVDIGIPEKVVHQANIRRFWMNRELCKQLLPERPDEGHKGTFGRVVVLAGSIGMTGAAALTAEAALRSGAGLVTLGIPASLNQIMEAKLTEVMTRPLPEANGQLAVTGIEEIRRLVANADVVAFGPGLGQSDGLEHLAQTLIRELSVPLVIDADGLNNLSQPVLNDLKNREALTILTPHPGEMAHLLGLSVAEIQEDRVGLAERFAREYGVVLVLKGVPTLTVFPDGQIYFNSTGNQGMATGGTGDVLTGIISGLLAQYEDPLSVAAGVYLHGLSGDLIAEMDNPRSLIAGDLLEGLAMAFNQLDRKMGDDRKDEKTITPSLG